MTFKIYQAKTITLSGYDVIFGSLEDFLNKPCYAFPPLQGVWNIALVDINQEDLNYFIDYECPEFLNISIYAREERIIKAGLLKESERDKYTIFMEDYISKYTIPLEAGVASELYKRCSGNLDRIEETLDEFKLQELEIISIRDLDIIVPPSEKVYAQDVVISMLIHGNHKIPRKGHTLSSYKFKNPMKLVELHSSILGREVSFYSIRKVLLKYLNMKKDYLENKPIKELHRRDESVLREIDIYSILYALLLFYNTTPNALFANVCDIAERKNYLQKEVLKC